MLTKITIRNFKLFEEVEIPLGNGFVFIGPNNGGKTSALQALMLWYIGLRKWIEKNTLSNRYEISEKRTGVTINRLDLIPLPIPEMDLIWLNRKVRKGSNENVRIDLIVEGISQGKEWKCGLEFDYANLEAFFCRPLRIDSDKIPNRMEIPHESMNIKLSFLPPMSGLATEEPLIQEGRINVLLGQGQTAEVLRNLCYRVYSKENEKTEWTLLVKHMEELFGVTLGDPKFVSNRGTIIMDYIDKNRETKLDLASAGRGMQQVLLLLAHLYDNSANTIFLLDEPDAHLEILRQRQIYRHINEVAEKQNSQIISASHSEILLNESAQRNSAVVFVGRPHILGKNQAKQVISSLKEIGFEYYYEAKRKGWILYLEGETDLRILQAFSRKLKHPSEKILQEPLVKYIGNNPNNARENFYALRVAKTDLRGFLLVDRMNKKLQNSENLSEFMWKKREIENYLCHRNAIISYIIHRDNKKYTLSELISTPDKRIDMQIRRTQIDSEIRKIEEAYKTVDKPAPFSDDIKASDEFLIPLFKNFSTSSGESISMTLQKKDFYKLIEYIPVKDIDEEIIEVLDRIVKISRT